MQEQSPITDELEGSPIKAKDMSSVMPSLEGWSCDQLHVSHDSNKQTQNHAQSSHEHTFSMKPLRPQQTQLLNSGDECSTHSSSQTDTEELWSNSESSFEWDDTLLDPILVQVNATSTPFQSTTIPVLHQDTPLPTFNSCSPLDVKDIPLCSKFPGIDDESLEAILSTCSGGVSLYGRFGAVCGSAHLMVTEVVSARHFWARIDDKVHIQVHLH